jgi:glutathione peroxidase
MKVSNMKLFNRGAKAIAIYSLLLIMALENIMASEFYKKEALDITGKKVVLSEYKGKVILVVNTASRCGLTKQYDALESMYKKHKDKGLVILGFPCNQFGGQEPGTEEEIQTFCSTKFDVSFPLFSKIEVNGSGTHPLYQWLKSEAPGLLGTEAIKWNFTKFLIDRDGKVVKRFGPKDAPKSFEKEVASLL